MFMEFKRVKGKERKKVIENLHLLKKIGGQKKLFVSVYCLRNEKGEEVENRFSQLKE